MPKNAYFRLINDLSALIIMDLQQIKNFLTLADELHFWNTSAKLNITQSALSRQIQSLEDELDVQLFERTKRSVKLTPAGEFLKVKWAGVLDEFNFIHQFAKKIEQGETGSIRIAHPDSISFSVLPQLILDISIRYPELKIEMIQLAYEDEQEFLTKYKIDLKFSRDLNRLDNISTIKLQTDHLALVIPDDHPFKTLNDVTAASLGSQKFIMPRSNRNSSYNQLTRQVFEHYSITPELFYTSDFGSTIISLITKKFGISIMPGSYAYQGYQGIRFIPLPFETNLYVNWRTDDNSPILKNILKMVSDLVPQ